MANLVRTARDAYEKDLVPQATPGDIRMEDVICWLSDNLPDDAVIANGAGNYPAVHRYYRFRNYRTQLALTSGSMGYGVPAAVAAKAAAPDSTVVCIAGDGCFMMTVQEMATAATRLTRHLHHREQRDVRHDSYASGTQLSSRLSALLTLQNPDFAMAQSRVLTVNASSGLKISRPRSNAPRRAVSPHC